MNQLSLLGLDDPVETVKEDPEKLLKSFLRTCSDCGLSRINPENPGFLCRGSIKARIAAICDSPLDEDIHARSVLQSQGRREWKHWMKHLGLTESQVFLTYLVHCKTSETIETSTRKVGKFEIVQAHVKPPQSSDISACFYRRTIRLLRALPNLEIVIALGIPVIETLLGDKYKQEKHEGFFFLSDRLTGIPVFALEHPRDYENAGLVRQNRIKSFLDMLRRRYIDQNTITKTFQYHAAARAAGETADLNHSLV
jgi:uracil-DNA glycosylase